MPSLRGRGEITRNREKNTYFVLVTIPYNYSDTDQFAYRSEFYEEKHTLFCPCERLHFKLCLLRRNDLKLTPDKGI